MFTTVPSRATRRRLPMLMAVAGLIVASCGGGDDSDSVATDPPATDPPATDPPVTDPPVTDPPVTDPPVTDPPVTDPPATDPPATDPPATDPPATDPPVTDPPVTDPPAPPLPDTPATAVIETAYEFMGGTVDPTLLPAQPGEVTAKWYAAGATYALVYEGLDPAAPACPGNSAQTTAGFDFVSNAPMPEGDCGTFPTEIESDATQGVQICGDRVSYLTIIPSDYVAVLYSSIERPIDDSGVGVTGFVLVEDPSTLPEIDPATLSC